MNLRQEQSLLYLLWELIYKQESVTIAEGNFGPEGYNTIVLMKERQEIIQQIISLVNSFLPSPNRDLELSVMIEKYNRCFEALREITRIGTMGSSYTFYKIAKEAQEEVTKQTTTASPKSKPS